MYEMAILVAVNYGKNFTISLAVIENPKLNNKIKMPRN